MEVNIVTAMPTALLFDVFGTVVDWRGSIIAEGEVWGRSLGIAIDWARFADRWRSGYAPAMNRVRRGELPWTRLDALHRVLLEDLLREFAIAGLDDAAKGHWNRAWHRLQPWPDSVPGLARLRRNFTIAPLSNGNVSMLAGMAKNAGLPWDLILSAELARHYKPDPEVYLTAVDLLDLPPQDVVMVAAHRSDLDAARTCGLRTAFIDRPAEFGLSPQPGARRPETAAPGDYDFVARDLCDLASWLGT